MSIKTTFVTFCDCEAALQNAVTLTASIREFAGRFSRSDILVAVPAHHTWLAEEHLEALGKLDAHVVRSETPVEARGLFYGDKPFAAAHAERHLQEVDATLAWIDNDAVVIAEPTELQLADGEQLAYVPVMHNRAGSLRADAPDELWARIYEIQSLSDDLLFPMTTSVDRKEIRAYFHCGLLSVRPGTGVMQGWAEEFQKVYQDSRVRRLCEHDQVRKIFLHQHALTGAILHRVDRAVMRELPDRYNCPILFDRQYDSPRPYTSLEGIAVIRRVVSLDKIGPDWDTQLQGPERIISWLKNNVVSWH